SLPSWPYWLLPQHHTVPPERIAQVCGPLDFGPPARTAIASVRFSTWSGTLDCPALVTPSWPYWLLPQHQTVPLLRTAHVYRSPALTSMASSMVETWTGTQELSEPLLPSWPFELRPQQEIRPFAGRAHVWISPACTETTLVIDETCTGIPLSRIWPLPSRPSPPLPQHHAVPLLRTAQVCSRPAPMERTKSLKFPLPTRTGLLPLPGAPSRPELLAPQQ